MLAILIPGLLLALFAVLFALRLVGWLLWLPVRLIGFLLGGLACLVVLPVALIAGFGALGALALGALLVLAMPLLALGLLAGGLWLLVRLLRNPHPTVGR